MDFWSRLLSPLSSGTSRQDQAKDPAKRLHRFEKEYGSLLSAWRTSSNLSRDSDAAETLEIRLQDLTNILSDESRRPLPHPCIQYAAIKQIYVPIGKIATTSYDEWIIKEAVLFFATLIESEEEAFVENPTFSASLTNLLVRITGMNGVPLGLDTESRVVELAFNITTKIRLDPDILPAWFKAHQAARQSGERDRDTREQFAGRTQRADFPLFYILMDYIHHEGKVGDFARTGLLYIIEAASSSASLEQWIVESDLSTLMATGLGALYSQLSRKLVIDHLPHDLPPILALSDYEHPASSYDIVSSCSPEFQSHLETFLSHLLFWQDVLNHCRSVDVKSTLLEHFQAIFLQQLLYPSLLESSDIDGGSSVAVLTYLRRILESLDHPDMINLILHYLLALPETIASPEGASTSSVSDARKRKSMDLATMMAEKSAETVTPLLFNLVDLILACLRSRNQQTIHVTLQLVSAILKRHHRYAVITLLKTEVLPANTADRTVGAHEQEVEYVIALASSIGGHGDFDDAYSNILKDTMARLESHPCSLRLVAPRMPTSNQKPPAVPDNDPLLNATLDLLETFFINPVEMNLSVTETVVDLAICGYMSIEGWLARSPNTYSFPEGEEAGDGTGTGQEERGDGMSVSIDELEVPPAGPNSDKGLSVGEAQMLKALEKCKRRPQWSQESVPRMLRLLKRLCDQVSSFKEMIPRFEELLQQRREAFQTAETMLDHPPPTRKESPASQGTPERPSPDRAARASSPSRPSALEGFAQRFLLELGTPSRSVSPRGRKEPGRSSGASTPGTTPGLSESSIPRAPRVPPKEFPINYADPNKSGTPRNFSPSSARSDLGLANDVGETSAASQAAAFAAIDQSILAKRVGLPDDKLKPIPIKLDRWPASKPGEAARTDGTDGSDAADTTRVSVGTTEDAEAGIFAEETKVSVSHVMTNVIIFQSFLLELAGLMQVRAGLFGEVRYV
ncbi:retinoic acid induced 16-like protein [Hirsutella rhossiliensis]|uniref:Retinoic acid induced 16-like protein n=1 Tax=Hirsutella rhossiliensis TaxID=111463 RepID=A0A9P8MYL7_9HYPO|nr:retinoic acid induced 16-like protein [Hirsutella rhossiliensis]KAH0963707.1 retinoic acid induced 16-like protein [Hirsutella rhossiliensis]